MEIDVKMIRDEKYWKSLQQQQLHDSNEYISDDDIKQILDWKDKGEAYERLEAFILHVMDCHICHKQGTDRCSWIIDANRRSKKPDVEIVVLPDTIEEAQKVMDGLK